MENNPGPNFDSTNTARPHNTGSSAFQSILILVILAIFSWFILRPKLSASMQTRSNLQAAQDQLAKIQSDESNLNKLINDLHSSPDEVALLDEALPLSGRVTKVNVLLESLVHSSGMTLAVLSTDDGEKTIAAGDKKFLENPYQAGRVLHTITITASVSGTMEQLKNLLELMETNGRVLDVDSLQIVGGEPETKFRLTVKAYAYEPVLK